MNFILRNGVIMTMINRCQQHMIQIWGLHRAIEHL